MATNNRQVNLILRLLGEEKMQSIDAYVDTIAKSNCLEFTSENQISNFFEEYLTEFYRTHRLNEIELMRGYTGIAFKNINAILRDNWNYEYNGELTEEKKEEYRKLADNLSEIIAESKVSLPNIKSYRGVSLSSFKGYGISSLEDLETLRDSYYFDSGFTSTSLLRERSFFDRPLEYHEDCNIEIEYIIPEGTEAIPLITDDLSYSKNQTEFLLNKSSLSKITEVNVNSEENKANLKMVVVPQYIWNYTETKQEEQTQTKR